MEMEIDGKGGDSFALGDLYCGGGAAELLNLTAGSSIPVCYHSRFGSHSDLMLLEVDDKILPDFLNNRVAIRGQPDEDAVLCTTSSTYAMKFVGTSNSVFLIPSGNSSHSSSQASILKVAPGTMELVQTAPKLDKLRSLLNEKPYNLEEQYSDIDSNNKASLYSWQDLLNLIQASENELKTALKSLSAVEIDGYWRIVSEKSMDEVLNMILNNSVLLKWSLNELSEDQVVSALEADNYSRKIVLHCLETYGTKVDNVWNLDERRVCMHFASQVLNGGKMKIEHFLKKWERAIPSGMNADLKMLEGEVLYEKTGLENWIKAFSVSSLSTVPAERFAALFRERARWEWKDLEPYIRDLRVPGLSAEALLIKYTRRSQPNPDVEPIFSSR